MRLKKPFLSVITICAISLHIAGCGNKNETPNEAIIRMNMNVAIYAAIETDGQIAPAPPALLQEMVSLDKLLHYDRDGDCITVPFHFKDSELFAKITESNINKRIVITADGEVVSSPLVRMRIANGACSFLLSEEQAQKFFPKETIEKLLAGKND